MYRSLKPDQIVATVDRLEWRIRERFPSSGLAKVAAELQSLAGEAAVRGAHIRRPYVPLRLVIGLLFIGLAALLARIATQLRLTTDLKELPALMQFVDSTLTSTVFLSGAIVFLITLERRMKRERCLTALHELRAVAHIIDMHQLTKDPDRLAHTGKDTAASPARTMTPFEMGRYLDYCTEMLAIVSKIAALYVQDFPEPTALDACDQIETLTTGLSRKIWQKISLLDRVMKHAEPAPAPAP